MQIRWDVGDANRVELEIGMFRTSLRVNGRKVPVKISMSKNDAVGFALADGRAAALTITQKIATRPSFELRVDGNLVVEVDQQPILCDACGKAVKPNDQFCAACGHEVPRARRSRHNRHVRAATAAMFWLAALFVVGGFLMWGIAEGDAQTALRNIAALDAHETYPKPIDGVTYTVGQLRDKIVWEARSVLIMHLSLAALMALLAWWSRRAPLAAVLVATATYAAVIVGSAIMDPASIAYGLLLKILIIFFLVRGIKAALALRTAHG